MKFQNCDEFECWLEQMLNNIEGSEEDIEGYEPSEEELEEVNAFEEIVGKVVYNYGLLEGMVTTAKAFDDLENPLLHLNCRQVQEQIDIGVEALERYFERIGVS